MLTIIGIYRELCATLRPYLGDRESNAAARMILEDVRGITTTDLAVNGDRTIEPETAAQLRAIAKQICDGQPVQYAIGKARFYGMDFYVTSAVLIPRPETEGLVDTIISDADGKSDLKVLDCGTGSGCIAIALARNLPFARVDAIDISDDALKIAQKNASSLKTDVNFLRKDILSMKPDVEAYDIIVSNPPYIADSEKADMEPRVKDFEPATALFVPDDDPLKFYRAIALYAADALCHRGRLYFEINPRFVDQMKQLLSDCRFSDIDFRRDYLGRYRYASATKQ